MMGRSAGLRGLVLGVLAYACTSNSYSMRNLKPAPPSLMVARKSPRTLLLVVDPARVPDRLGPLKWDLGTVEVADARLFVSRDLASALANYFEKVEVVAPGYAPPPQPHMVADVKVDSARSQVTGEFAFGVLTWGVALRPSEMDEYLFSYAGKSQSDPARSGTAMITSMFENALTDFLKAYTDKDIHNKVMALPPPRDATPPATHAAGARHNPSL